MSNWIRTRILLWFGGWKLCLRTREDAHWIAVCRLGVESERRVIGPYTLLRPKR